MLSHWRLHFVSCPSASLPCVRDVTRNVISCRSSLPWMFAGDPKGVWDMKMKGLDKALDSAGQKFMDLNGFERSRSIVLIDSNSLSYQQSLQSSISTKHVISATTTRAENTPTASAVRPFHWTRIDQTWPNYDTLWASLRGWSSAPGTPTTSRTMHAPTCGVTELRINTVLKSH